MISRGRDGHDRNKFNIDHDLIDDRQNRRETVEYDKNSNESNFIRNLQKIMLN